MHVGPFHSLTSRLILIVSLISISSFAKTPDPLSDPGFQHFYNLEYEEALKVFRARADLSPTDPAAQNYLAQTVLYHEMFRNRALDSDLLNASNAFMTRPRMKVTSEHHRLFDEAINRSISICQQKLTVNSRDAASLYSLGVSYALRANWNAMVTHEFFNVLRDATNARKLHNQVLEIDPDLMDARFVQAAHDYVVGSLPGPVKLLGFLAGFKGDREAGMRNLRLVAEGGSMNRVDAAVLLSAILRRERRSGEAVPLLASVSSQFPRNYLFRFELARMYADSGDKGNAIASLDRIDQLRAKGSPGFKTLPPEQIAYDKGNVYFWYDDLDMAISELKRATADGGGALDPDAAALAWLRLGQALDLKGERGEARSAYSSAARVSPASESAKEARAFLSYPYKRKRRA